GNSTLGDGEMVARYDCLNAAASATLRPLTCTLAATPLKCAGKLIPNKILIESTINSVALDSIQSPSNIDWLLLDELNDNLTALNHGKHALTDSLLIDIRVPFQATHLGQAQFHQVNEILDQYGFSFFRF